MNNPVISNTPWERYYIDDIEINVKREDLSCPEPGPSFSKIRGLWKWLQHNHFNCYGVLDTRHSKAGWGTSYLCSMLGYKCIDFYPVLKGQEDIIPDNQKKAKEFGAKLYPLKAGMSAVLYNIARRHMCVDFNGIMLPNGLKLYESVDETALELCNNTSDKLFNKGGTWVVSISSGTIGAGVALGLATLGFKGKLICHHGYSRSKEQTMKYFKSMAGIDIFDKVDVEFIDEGYEYKDEVEKDWIPFPSNEFYDAKAFTWIADNIYKLKEPIIFWNIGA